MYNLGYTLSLADPDVWLRKAVKPCGFKYYEYVLCYVDNVLSISHDPDSTMKGIQQTFKLKGDKYGPPDSYLGAVIDMMENVSGTRCWTQSSDKYISASIQNVEEVLKRKGNSLPKRCATPFTNNYRPELDALPELKAEGVRYFQELISILRWACELGRLDCWSNYDY